jgi:LytS/YehU family sensor histidine kinase
MQALKLESQLAKAQLEALRSQLQPHFLFNTLNSISALMQDDVEAAEDMLADLSYMLRVSLDNSTTQEVKLADELHLLEAYVRIQKRRFQGRLQVDTEAPPETLEAQVPSLLLQPLVENAIRHGLAPLSRTGKIQIASRKDAARLLITVSDDGCGLPPEYREGIGLRNTRERLKQLYGAEAELHLHGAPGQGVTATVTVPFRIAEKRLEIHEHEHHHIDSGRRTFGAPANSFAPVD